jgi:hypothetical protein
MIVNLCSYCNTQEHPSWESVGFPLSCSRFAFSYAFNSSYASCSGVDHFIHPTLPVRYVIYIYIYIFCVYLTGIEIMTGNPDSPIPRSRGSARTPHISGCYSPGHRTSNAAQRSYQLSQPARSWNSSILVWKIAHYTIPPIAHYTIPDGVLQILTTISPSAISCLPVKSTTLANVRVPVLHTHTSTHT